MDLFPPSTRPEEIHAARFRTMMVEGDNMEPTLRSRWDYVLVAPVDRYCGEGLYVLECDGAMVLKRCESNFRGGVWLGNDNKIYPPQEIARDIFNEHVVAMVVADIKVRDHRLLEGREQEAEPCA